MRWKFEASTEQGIRAEKIKAVLTSTIATFGFANVCYALVDILSEGSIMSRASAKPITDALDSVL